jgi:lipoprotein-releasing system ATP-binding protein
MKQTTPAAASQPARHRNGRAVREPEQRAESIPPIIQVRNLEKTYTTARGALTLFQGLDLDVQAGEMVAIVGQSGAGKSTLLHILGALDAPTAGSVHCASVNVAGLSQNEAAEFRNREIGYVWQFHYLLPEFTARENVAMPLMARGVRKVEALIEADHWLKEVGLEDRGDHRPGELSGGEQQRVALARALVNHPRLLLADEPTGDLDEKTAGLVFDLIERLHATHGLTSILVTHNLDLAARCTRTLRLEAGRLESRGLESGMRETGRRLEAGKRRAGGPEAGRPEGGRLTAKETSVSQTGQAAADCCRKKAPFGRFWSLIK